MVAKIFILIVSIAVIATLVMLYLKNENFKNFVDSLLKRGRKLAKNQESLIGLAAADNELETQKKLTEVAEEKQKTAQEEVVALAEQKNLNNVIILAQKKVREKISEEEITLQREKIKAEVEKEVMLEKLKAGVCPEDAMMKPAGWLERNWWFPLVLFFTLFIILIKFGVLI